ncbi:MAG TPA: glycosyltransferase [Terriglobales bacterium]|nr:glycosyltransferase [Terriglobales bacterium]
MRVLTLTPFYPTASDDAAGCFIAEPIRALEQFGIESCVLAVEPFYRARSTPNGHPAKWVRYAAIPGGIGLAFAGAFLYASLRPKVHTLHRDWNIDLIHAHAALPCGHAAALLARELHIPFVVTVHGLDVFFTAQVQGYPGHWCQRVSQSVYRSATRVICISRKVANKLANGLPHSENIEVIHNGVDPTRFSPGQNNPDRPIVLSVGNLIPTKGHALLLRAFAAVHANYSNLTCELIGDGSERSRLEKLAQDLNIAAKVRFLGQQKRACVSEAVQRCTIFALPSHYEGLGCVYLEAMSAAKPAIGCRAQGIEDIIRHGDNGWLVAPHDLSGTVSALSTLLHDVDLRKRIGSAARKAILAKHTLAHHAAQIAQLYGECVA